ncbi:MAG: rhomboid family intramembrane serine protease [Gemmataceae bacterium]|nr:rhomboid family intramembrane serine protease [Gemmataceae bacterium]
MGVYDRDYYRNEPGGFARWVPTNRVCQWLIGINIAVFIIQLVTRYNPQLGIAGPVTEWLDLKPDRVIRGEIWRLITSAFLHDQAWQHIVFNMLFLWWFGRAVEELYGSREFLATYLVAAAVSSLAFCIQQWTMNPGKPAAALGASGAVTAMLVIYAMHYPTQTVYLFFVIPVPIIVMVALYVVADAIGLMGGRAGESVAFAAHLGGAAFGFLYFRYHWRVMNWWPSRMSMRPRKFNRPRLKVYREPAEEDTALAHGGHEEVNELEEQLDSVLEKVARLGKSSLTDKEHRILLKASEKYKQRRK